MERLFRPALRVTGCWIHGSNLEFAIADEDQKKNSETMIEIMCRAIDTAYRNHGRHLPLGLHVQADNTYREIKNQFCMRFLIQLVMLGIFRWASAGFLTTGHSPPGMRKGTLEKLATAIAPHRSTCNDQ